MKNIPGLLNESGINFFNPSPTKQRERLNPTALDMTLQQYESRHKVLGTENETDDMLYSVEEVARQTNEESGVFDI